MLIDMVLDTANVNAAFVRNGSVTKALLCVRVLHSIIVLNLQIYTAETDDNTADRECRNLDTQSHVYTTHVHPKMCPTRNTTIYTTVWKLVWERKYLVESSFLFQHTHTHAPMI